jgi:uncharacterized membrane protein required for colicin V production
VNLLDILLLLAIASAVATGLRWGFIHRTASWLGLIAGVALATRTVPPALSLVADYGQPGARLVVGLVVLAVTVTVVATLFQAIGLRLRHHVHDTPLSTLDRGAGGIAGALAVLALVWVLVPAAAEVPGEVARQVRTSAVAEAVANLTPEPPDTVRALRNLVASSRFPEVFADLQASPVTGPPPAEIPVDEAVVGGGRPPPPPPRPVAQQPNRPTKRLLAHRPAHRPAQGTTRSTSGPRCSRCWRAPTGSPPSPSWSCCWCCGG